MAALPELWESLKSSITTYTGLSPATFFTVIALTLVTYYIISGLFGSSSDHAGHHRSSRDFEELEPLPPPVQLGEITEQDLRLYDGSDAKKPLLMAIKGQIYDVSQSRVFYGPGGPYALFAGRDASRALAKMSFEEKDLTSDISGLGVFELDALQDWEYKFMSKYVKVGTIKKTVPVTEGTTEGEPSQTADAETSEPSEAIVGEASKPVEVSPKATEAAESEAAETEAAETEAAKTEDAKTEDVKPVEGHTQTLDGDKDYAGNVLVTDAEKKE